MENIFEKACLVQLSTSVWNGSRIIAPGLMKRVSEKNAWIKGRKFLINPELLGPVKTSVHQARKIIQKNSLPFPINSIYLVPKESLLVIDQQLQKFYERFWKKVSEFEQVYDQATEEARNVLGDLYNESDYPQNIHGKFRFEWRFLTLNVPSSSSVLSPEVYEREKAKFVAMMEETRNMASMALAKEFSSIVNLLTERLQDGKKIIKPSMLNKLNDFLNGFEKRNLFEDERLESLISEARRITGGVSAFNIRYDNEMQKRIKTDMAELNRSIEEAIEDLPRRRIRLAA